MRPGLGFEGWRLPVPLILKSRLFGTGILERKLDNVVFFSFFGFFWFFSGGLIQEDFEGNFEWKERWNVRPVGPGLGFEG